MGSYFSQPPAGTIAEEIDNFGVLETDTAHFLAELARLEHKASMAVLLGTPDEALEAIHAARDAAEEKVTAWLESVRVAHLARLDEFMRIRPFTPTQEESGDEQITAEDQLTTQLSQTSLGPLE